MTNSMPTESDCIALWDQYHTAMNVRDHLRAVCQVAMTVARAHADKGDKIDLDLVQAGALLHDLLRFVGMQQLKLNLFKTAPSNEDLECWRDLSLKYPRLQHAEAAALELREREFPEELCKVVRKHDYFLILDPIDGPVTLAEKIIYYADKRVLHDRIVSLDDRLKDGKLRYPQFATSARAELATQAIYELERELFEGLKLKPEDVG